MEIRHLANAGVLISGSIKVIIDAPSLGADPFPGTDVLDRDQMVKGDRPFEGIDLFLYTHEHPDHFDPEAVAAILSSQRAPRAILNSAAFRLLSDVASRSLDAQVLVPTVGQGQEQTYVMGPARVTVYSLVHEGGEPFKDIENFGILLEMDGKRIFHLGDTGLTDANFQVLGHLKGSVDLLIAPFPNVGVPSARKRLKEYLDPLRIMAVHFPAPAADQFGWTKSAKESFERSSGGLGDVFFAAENGEVLKL